MLSASGQSLQVVDQLSGGPIAHATVIGKCADQKTEFWVTDQNGSLNIDRSFYGNCKFIVRHVGFESRQVSWPEDGVIRLKPSEKELEEVVVTGQFEPQSARNSVYSVRTISSERLRQQGATNIQEALSNALNLVFSRDNATGVSGLSWQGLSGQYVKVLVDGVPVTGRSGANNEIDLAQFNVNSIDRIEMVDGPMAVNYGADALAGVINIITKKATEKKWEASVVLHQETVGEEFSYFNEGTHAPSAALGYQWNDHWNVRLEGRLQKFGGWKGNDPERDSRDKLWHPKTQYFGSGLLRYQKGQQGFHLRFDYLDELIEDLGAVNDRDPLKDPTAEDEEFATNRYQLQAQGDLRWGKVHYRPIVGYTYYERTATEFIKNLITGSENPKHASEQDTVFFRTFFSRQTVHFPLFREKVQLQSGLELTHETGGGAGKLKEGEHTFFEVAGFASAEWQIANAWQLRLGVRYTHNNQYAAVPTPSVHLKYDFHPNWQLRLAYARGFRAPSLRERFHEFVDASHNILGNEDLQAERSHNFNADLGFRKGDRIMVQLSGFYNAITDQIGLVLIDPATSLTSYENYDRFRTTGTTLTTSFNHNQWNIHLGASLIGRYQSLNDGEFASEVPKFLFSPEANMRVVYTLPKSEIQFAVFGKYNGPVERYTINENEKAEKRKVDGFALADLTVLYPVKKWLTITAGSRNVFDVVSIRNTATGGVHGGGNRVPVSFGRSFFLRVQFVLNGR